MKIISRRNQQKRHHDLSLCSGTIFVWVVAGFEYFWNFHPDPWGFINELCIFEARDSLAKWLAAMVDADGEAGASMKMWML